MSSTQELTDEEIAKIVAVALPELGLVDDIDSAEWARRVEEGLLGKIAEYVRDHSWELVNGQLEDEIVDSFRNLEAEAKKARHMLEPTCQHLDGVMRLTVEQLREQLLQEMQLWEIGPNAKGELQFEDCYGKVFARSVAKGALE